MSPYAELFSQKLRELESEISSNLSKLTKNDPWDKQKEEKTGRQCNHLKPFHLCKEKVD